ncbi:MAG: hypothetical protein PHS93_07690 [Candidatus Omnitrophica bacterium]|nr:hypothetical protein [Candidatus Omnitrophota bacterium]
MKVLFDAIMTKYLASTTLVAANKGGLHRGRVPDRTKTPYISMDLLDGRPEDTFSEYAETYNIQFNIVDSPESQTDDTVDSIFTLLTALFDYCSLTISGYTHVIMRRTFSNCFYDTENTLWQYIVQYEVMMQKT